MSRVVDLVKEKISPIIESLGYEVVDIEYEKKYDSMNLTIYIYHEPTVTLDDCESVHHAVNDEIDKLNPTNDAPYVLNISSPGLDRPFKTFRDFERNYGKEVEVKLFAPYRGKKLYEGVLKEKNDNKVTITCGNADISFEISKIVFVRPLVKFE